MSGTISLRRIVTHPYCSLACYLGLVFVLPRFGGVAMMVGCAGVLSALIAAEPERFRNRNSSLRTAYGLAGAMWIMAAVVTAMWLLGAAD